MQNRIFDGRPPETGLRTERFADASGGNSDSVRERVSQVRDTVEHLVAERPVLFLASAAGLGILLGWWVKRK